MIMGIPELGVKPIDVVQLDYSRVGGIGDHLATMLMARKTGVSICPHAGGVGLCEGVVNVQSLKQALFGKGKDEVLEYVEGGLHEGVYSSPALVQNGHYILHKGAIGNGTALTDEGERKYKVPGGTEWLTDKTRSLASEYFSSAAAIQR